MGMVGEDALRLYVPHGMKWTGEGDASGAVPISGKLNQAKAMVCWVTRLLFMPALAHCRRPLYKTVHLLYQ